IEPVSMARPPDDLERFRAYLGVLARMRLGPRYKGRVDESGVVQETLKDAYRALHELEAWTEVQKLAWLKRILLNNLIDAVRKTETREVPIRDDLDGSSVRGAYPLIAGGDSPSEHAKRNEQWRHLAEILPELPEDQKTAVELHYLDGLSL